MHRRFGVSYYCRLIVTLTGNKAVTEDDRTIFLMMFCFLIFSSVSPSIESCDRVLSLCYHRYNEIHVAFHVNIYVDAYNVVMMASNEFKF